MDFFSFFPLLFLLAFFCGVLLGGGVFLLAFLCLVSVCWLVGLGFLMMLMYLAELQ